MLNPREIAVMIAPSARPGFSSVTGEIPLADLVHRFTEGPARIGRIAGGRLADGERAEVNLVDLEHERIAAVMGGTLFDHAKAVTPWWMTQAHLTAWLQQVQRFRDDPLGRVQYALHYDSENCCHWCGQYEGDPDNATSIAQQAIELCLEGRVAARLVVGRGQFLQRSHQRLRNEHSPETTVVAAGIRLLGERFRHRAGNQS